MSSRRALPRRLGSIVAVGLLLAVPAGGRDRGADGSFDKRSSAHFVLYQDVDIDETGGFRGSRRFEQEVLSELERAYDAVGRLLGLRPDRKISVVIYDPALFDREFRGLFRFQAAGFYNGVIRVRGATLLTGQLSRVLHHELVHAALDAEAPSLLLPGWVNEGCAEWLEVRAHGKRGLSSREHQVLVELRRQGRLQALRSLNAPAFGGMDPDAAAVAYLQSYALIELLVRRHGERDLPRFLQSLIKSRNLDRALSRIYRLDPASLEAALLEDLS